jgi:hypothetical protein
MPSHLRREGSGAGRSPKATRRANNVSQPAPLPAPWTTHLTCPTCHTPEALLLFDGVGTVCRECGEATQIQGREVK